MHKLRLVSLLLVALVTCRREAETAPAEPIESAAPSVSAAAPNASASPTGQLVNKPLLWEVSTAGGKSYLFGTMHVGIEADHLPRVVWAKINEATTFVMEADVSDPGAMVGMAKEAMLPADRDLRKELGPELWAKTVKAAGGAVPESMLAHFKPWFVVVTITAQLMPKTQPMDASLQKKAKEEGDRLSYLESWQEQVRMLDQAIDIEVLKDTVKNFEEEKRMAHGMHRAYLDGDAAALEKVAFEPEEMKSHPKLYDLLFFQRNDRWLPVLQQHLQKGGAFIAVGAAHLLGDRGLVAQLGKKGTVVQRVP